MAATNRSSTLIAQAQDAQRRAEQELHAKNMRIVNLESDLTSARDLLFRRDAEIDRLRGIASSASSATSNTSSVAAADRTRLRDEAVKMQWLRELALLELQESIARNVMLDASRDDSFDIFSEAFVEIGQQQGDESATERLRHRINTLLFQLRITQSVQIKKLREQIAELSSKLNDVGATAAGQPQQQYRQQQQQEQEQQQNEETTPSIPPGSIVITEQEKKDLIETEVKKQLQEQTAALRKELAQAEKARLDLAGRISDTSREMREHRQNSLTALSEAQKWEAEAKKLKTQLRDMQQEIKALEEERLQQQQQQQHEQHAREQQRQAAAASMGRDESPRERETAAMNHHRELSELQLLVDDLQSQVASSQMRLHEAERKLRNERDRANMASSRCSQLEDELAVIHSGGNAPGERIDNLQHEIDTLNERLAEYRIALNSEKQAYERVVKDKDQTIAQLERHLSALQLEVATAAKRASEPLPETVERINELRNKVSEVERELRAEKNARERESAVATATIAELELAISTKEAAKTAEEQQRQETAQRNSTLEAQNSQLQNQLSRSEAQNLDLERKLRVTQRQADELERDLTVKVEQFVLLSQQNANSTVQKEQLGKAQVKLDGARHSITMLLLSQQYLAALIDLFADSVAAATEDAMHVREAKMCRDLQNKHRDQMQSQQLQHAAQLEEMKVRFVRQLRLDSDLLSPKGGTAASGAGVVSGTSSSPSPTATSPSYGANEGAGLVFSSSTSPVRGGNDNSNNNTSNNGSAQASALDLQISLERKAFAYLSAMDLVAAHSNSVTRLFLDAYIIASANENEQLQRRLREQHTERNTVVSNMDSRLQILQTEKTGLQAQLSNTQKRLEDRVAHLTAEVKEATRREKELRDKADAAVSEQRRLQTRVATLQQELSQLEDYAEDLKTSRELERSVLHARIQTAEEANAANKSHLESANANANSSVSDLSAALEAAHLQIAREHAQVVELEGTIAELKGGVVKERRSRAALEATHREEIAVLEQRLGELRAQLAALQLQRDPMMLGEDGGLLGAASGMPEFSRPQLQRELKSTHEKLSLANSEAASAQERVRELERKLTAEREHNAASKEHFERLEGEAESAKRAALDARKELDASRTRHATELLAREGEFDRARKKLLEQISSMQDELSALKLQQHSQQMDHMSELHKVERHCLDRIATAEGEATSSNRQMFEELQDRKERVGMLEKKLSSVTAQLENRDQLLKAARDHIESLQVEQQKKSGTDDEELAHYRQELRDLSNALVDAKRSHISAADRSRQIMAHSEAELADLRNEVTSLRADIVELDSKHRAELLTKDTNHFNDAKELKHAKGLLDEYREKITTMDREHSAESAELRRRIESLLSQVATEDVMDQLRHVQKQAEIQKQKCADAEEYTEYVRMKNNQIEAECERLRAHATQVERENEEASSKLKVTEASVEKKVDQAMQMMQRKIEVEAQLWDAKASSTQAENSQLRRLLLEEQRTSSEAAQRIAQLEMALDDLELEMIEKAVVGSRQEQNQQQLQQQQRSSSPTSRNLLNDSSVTTYSSSPNRRSPVSRRRNLDNNANNMMRIPIDINSQGVESHPHQQHFITVPVSSVRQRLIELPSLTQVIAAKQSSRLEIERLEFERRTEIEADVFEWRWAIAAFANLLQSVFHSFSVQLMRASDHAATIESDVSQLESDVRSSLVIAQRKNSDYAVELERWKLCCEESETRMALVRFESYQWVEATRMLSRELARHAKILFTSNKRLTATSAALQQQQQDIFLFHRRQLQEFEKSNRHQISFALGQTFGFFQQTFVFARTVLHSYEKKIRTLERRLELMVSSERSISDVNLAVLTRKHQQQQHLIAQHQKARQNQMDLQLVGVGGGGGVSPFAPSASLLFGGGGSGVGAVAAEGNRENAYRSVYGGAQMMMLNSHDVNLRALPEFKRADLTQTPLETIQRDEIVQRRLLQDLFADWLASTTMYVLSLASRSPATASRFSSVSSPARVR